jgi:hypothetical protein
MFYIGRKKTPMLPSFQQQRIFEKTNSELFHFLAAISVQEKDRKLAHGSQCSEFRGDVHCLSKFRS